MISLASQINKQGYKPAQAHRVNATPPGRQTPACHSDALRYALRYDHEAISHVSFDRECC